MLWVILIMAFYTTVFLTFSLYYLVFWKKSLIRTRLKVYVQQNAAFDEPQVNTAVSFLKDIRKLTEIIKKIFPQKIYLDSKRKKLAQAAVLMKPEEFIGLCFICGLVIGAVFFWIFGTVLLSPVGFIIGFFLPNLFLENMKNRRTKKLNSQLPEALSIISNGLRAGYSIVQAMTVASKELQEPISQEFDKVIRDNSLGKPLEDALVDMANKVEDEDLGMFVTAMLIQRQVGGNLSEILESISRTIRERVKIRGEIKTLTSQSRFSAVVISIMPIGLAVAIAMLNPAYIKILVESPIGVAMVVGAVILDIIGIIVLRKIVNIEI